MDSAKRNLAVNASNSKQHKKKLKAASSAFFAFLDKKPKPTDEAVRSEFIRRELEWKAYCVRQHLDIRTSMMFNAKVAYEWERKYVKKKTT